MITTRELQDGKKITTITTCELQDGTKINITDNKLYRIGLSMSKDDIMGNIMWSKKKKTHNKLSHTSPKYIETFYSLSPNEIKRHVKEYDGELVYIVEM